MPRFFARSLASLAAAAAAVLLSLAPAFAAEGPAASDSTTDIVPMVLWSLVGVGIFGLVLSVFYLFKRRVGGFPKDPSWVAPITIMPSKDLPGDVDTHEAAAPGHEPAHHADPHGHAPAAAHH